MPDEFGRDHPDDGKKGRSLAAEHGVRLVEVLADGSVVELGAVRFSPEASGELEGAFRFLPLEEAVQVEPAKRYVLLQSTVARDGDRFRDPASFDGLSPIVHPDFQVERAVLVRDGDPSRLGGIPAFSDMDADYDRYRLPLGPTLQVE